MSKRKKITIEEVLREREEVFGKAGKQIYEDSKVFKVLDLPYAISPAELVKEHAEVYLVLDHWNVFGKILPSQAGESLVQLDYQLKKKVLRNTTTFNGSQVIGFKVVNGMFQFSEELSTPLVSVPVINDNSLWLEAKK